MKNIVWKKPDGSLSITTIFGAELSTVHGMLLQQRGDIPTEWVAVAHDVQSLPSDYPQECWRWDNGIVIDTASLRACKAQELGRALELAIDLPVTSSALGQPYVYAADAQSRGFLSGLVALGRSSPYQCTDGAGVAARRQHTAAQLVQVGEDIAAAIELRFVHYEAVIAALSDPALTAAEIMAINW